MATNTNDLKIIDEARERAKEVITATQILRDDALDDIRFTDGEQWPADIIRERNLDNRPSLVINRLPTFINQISNDGKISRPNITVRPVDRDADERTAKVINGLLRSIQYTSKAKAAYDNSFESAVRCSLGYFRILTKYDFPESFDQTIEIQPIQNPLSVYFPFHLCKEEDYSDAPYCFITEIISREQFERQYPDSEINSWDVQSLGDDSAFWVTESGVRIAEYFKVEDENFTLYKLADGTTTDSKEGIDDAFIVQQRKSCRKKVMWYKMSATEILDSKEFPSEIIPIVPVVGAKINIEGTVKFYSLIRWAKDAQRAFNYWKSAETEHIALIPKSPYIAAEGQLEGYEDIWRDANMRNIGVLPYKPISIGGVAVPPPQRTQSISMDAGIVNAIREAVDDIKACTGIFDASLGSRGNETSGKAILARQREGDIGSYHFYDNMAMAMRSAGRIIVDMIPKLYNTERVVRILGEDMIEQVVTLNTQYIDETGEERLYDVTVGKYDVVVETGPSFNTQRQETANLLVQLGQANPQLMGLTSDLLAKFLDAPQDIVDRLRKTIPPALLSEEQPARVVQQQLQQAQTLIQSMDQVIQKMSGELTWLRDQWNDRVREEEIRLEGKKIQAQANLERTAMIHAHDRGMAAAEAVGAAAEHKQASAEQLNALTDAIKQITGRISKLETLTGQVTGSPASAQPAEE